MSARRSYKRPALDATGQHISDAPYWQGDGETVDVVDDRIDAAGEIRVEVFPVPHERELDERLDSVEAIIEQLESGSPHERRANDCSRKDDRRSTRSGRS